MESDADKAWCVLPEVQGMVHTCSPLGHYIGYETPVQITAHLNRPDEALIVRKDWQGPVMESRAACGCVRYRGVYAFELKPVGKAGELEVCVLVNANDRAHHDLRLVGGVSC